MCMYSYMGHIYNSYFWSDLKVNFKLEYRDCQLMGCGPKVGHTPIFSKSQNIKNIIYTRRQ